MTDERWEPWAGDDEVRNRRTFVLEGQLPAYVRRAAAATPAIQSMLLSVAQYWNDRADDEVHFRAYASARDWYDVRRAGGHDLGRYGEDVPAFEPFCAEQPDNPYDERPLAIARRAPGGEIAVELVGDLLRPWLDLPRDRAEPVQLDARLRAILDDPDALPVLADALQERGDERGELIALSGAPDARDRVRELTARWSRTWLRGLDPVVPRAGLHLRAGVPDLVELYLDDDSAAEVARIDPDDDVWWTVRRIRFGPRSLRIVPPGVARLRSLGPLDDAGVRALAAAGAPALEELAVEPSCAAALEALLAATPPRLRVLRVLGERAGTGELIELARRLDGFARLEIARTLEPADVAAWAQARPAIEVRLSQLDPDAIRGTGWCFGFHGDAVELTRLALWRDADDRDAVPLVDALPPQMPVTLAPGPWWQPTPEEARAILRGR